MVHFLWSISVDIEYPLENTKNEKQKRREDSRNEESSKEESNKEESDREEEEVPERGVDLETMRKQLYQLFLLCTRYFHDISHSYLTPQYSTFLHRVRG